MLISLLMLSVQFSEFLRAHCESRDQSLWPGLLFESASFFSFCDQPRKLDLG